MNHRRKLTPFAVQDPGEFPLSENLILKKYPGDKKISHELVAYVMPMIVSYNGAVCGVY